MKMNWVESRIYVKPSYTGVVNSTNAELVERAYLDGYEDARKDFISCIENLHKDEIEETKSDKIKVGDEVIAKLPSRKDSFKSVVIKVEENDPVYQFFVIDKEGYTFWISKENIFKTDKTYPILDMLAELGG